MIPGNSSDVINIDINKGEDFPKSPPADDQNWLDVGQEDIFSSDSTPPDPPNSSRYSFFNNGEREEKKPSVERLSPGERPLSLSLEIEKRFARLREEKNTDYYTYKGRDGYVFNSYPIIVNTADVLKAKRSTSSSSPPILVVDVGTGDGTFPETNRGKKTEVVGVSCQDMRKDKSAGSDYYRILDAERLDEYFANVDVVFSAVTYVHFLDSVGSIIRTYKTLKLGGELFIDYFNIQGCEDYYLTILHWLKTQGHLVVGKATGYIQGFIIQKTEKPLNFPVTYNGLTAEGIAIYSPTPELIALHSSANLEEHYFRQGVGVIKTNEIPMISEIAGRCRSLAELFVDESYKNLGHEIQHQLICHVVAKTTTYTEAKRAFDALPPSFSYFDKSYNGGGDGISSLCFDVSFQRIAPREQEIILQFHAARTLMNYGLALENEATLGKMGVPFTRETPTAIFSGTATKLQFDKIGSLAALPMAAASAAAITSASISVVPGRELRL